MVPAALGGRGSFRSPGGQDKENGPRPRPGAPEGMFPNLDDARQRSHPTASAPLSIPSVIRSPRNPLLPRNGKRVGDPLTPLDLANKATGNTELPVESQSDREMVTTSARMRRITAHTRTDRHRRQQSSVPPSRSHHVRTRASINVAPPPIPDDSYVQNFFQWALVRQANSSELLYWNDILRKAYANGQGSMVIAVRELGKTLFESSEYAARMRNNYWYIYDLYKTYLMRDPDSGGWTYWEGLVPSLGREAVRRAFDESTEYINLMGTVTPNGSASSAASSLLTARVDPFNQPGSGLAARDGEWSLTILSLAGRAGLDLGLVLSNSSLVWTRSGPYIYFDEDNGFPSPGFRLGFPTVQEKFFDAQVRVNAYVLLTASGNRVELRQVGASNIYEAVDSSYLQLTDNGRDAADRLRV